MSELISVVDESGGVRKTEYFNSQDINRIADIVESAGYVLNRNGNKILTASEYSLPDHYAVYFTGLPVGTNIPQIERCRIDERIPTMPIGIKFDLANQKTRIKMFYKASPGQVFGNFEVYGYGAYLDDFENLTVYCFQDADRDEAKFIGNRDDSFIAYKITTGTNPELSGLSRYLYKLIYPEHAIGALT